MAPVRQNTAEGGSHGTTVTTGNSGGASGDAFATVVGDVKFDDSHEAAGGMGYKFQQATTESVYVAMADLGAVELTTWSRWYIWFAAFPNASNASIQYIANGNNRACEVRIDSAGQLLLVDAGAVTRATSSALSTSTLYRVECKVFSDQTAGTMEVRYYLGDSLTPVQTVTATAIDTAAAVAGVTRWNFGARIVAGATTGFILYADELAAATDDWIGPASAPAGGAAPFVVRFSKLRGGHALRGSSVGGDATVTPAVIASSFTVPQVVPQAASSVTPAAAARSFVVPQAVPQNPASVTPAAAARSFVIPQATPSAGSSVTPAAAARSFVIPQATPQASSSVTPAAAARSFVIPQAVAGAATTVTPMVIARAFNISLFGSGFSDSFNRADSGTLGTSDSGHGWTSNVGTWSIVGNQASADATGSAQASFELGISDQVVEADLLHASAQQHVMARYTTATSGYLAGFQVGSNTLSLWKFSPGFTQIGTYSHSAHTGRVRLEVIGTSIKVYLDGTERIAVTDATITTGNRAGLFGQSGLFDNFNQVGGGAQVLASSSVTPALVSRSFLMGQVAAGGATSVTPAVIAQAFTMGQVAAGAATSVTPALVSRSFLVPQATTNLGAGVTPAVIARSFVIPQAGLSTAVNVTPGAVPLAFLIGQVVAGAATTVTPATIARAFSLPQSAVQAGVMVTPAVIARAFGVPQVNLGLGTSVTPAVIARAFVIGQATAGAGISVTPAVIARAFLIAQAVATGGADISVTPATIARAFTVLQAAVRLGATATPGVLALAFGIPQPNVFIGNAGVPVIGGDAVFVYGTSDAVLVGAGATTTGWGNGGGTT